MSKGASKKWVSFDFEKEQPSSSNKEVAVVSEPIKFTKTSNSYKKSFNFFEAIKPRNESDLAVHPKKIRQLEEWIQENVINKRENGAASFLLLSGPVGSGKTVCVNVICKKLGINIMEWVNPVDQDYEVTRGPGKSVRFLEFLLQSKYSSLLDMNSKKVAVVEDFPNSVIRKPEEFFNILKSINCNSKCAIIFICADGDASLNLANSLFPQEIRNCYNITNVSFNACSATLLKNALNRAQSIVKENLDLFNMPTKDVLDAIVATSGGDIRSSMNQFFFACSKGVKSLEIEGNTKPSGKRKRSNSKSNAKLSHMQKDECLTLFHGIGRTLNPKRRVIKEDGSWRLDCDLDLLTTSFTPNPKRCVSFLHENYLKYFGNIEDVSAASDVLSLAQKFIDTWSEEYDKVTSYGLWIAVLGLMVHNEHKVSKWTQIRAPPKLLVFPGSA